ncbi:MAG: TspO protein [Candidatus Levybacteria bacterium RIFCSPLOWO2_01_FULL_39_24]|nr:MAG: TspO protein [Candidatus Levybacteria bacterium RIFCSPHIGHO2_01_FULL_40_16]OGH46175.1 MAG: TspO protein [Candidatus Levybacteria bacterium RIFCSPLOWO2_01_FULL_39_24]
MRLNLPKLIVSIALPLIVGFSGSVFTVSAVPTWYATLNKPSFSPPNYLFGPVWTILYILMGISLYFLWTAKKKGEGKAIKLFLIQLVLNFFWSIIFFGWHNPQAAFLEIISLWIFIFLTIRQSLLISKTSAYLLYPYLVWVSFASILNLSIVLLN